MERSSAKEVGFLRRGSGEPRRRGRAHFGRVAALPAEVAPALDDAARADGLARACGAALSETDVRI